MMAVWLSAATLFISPLALWRERMPVIARPENWVGLAAIGLVPTSAAFLTLFWLLPWVGGTTASTIAFIAPVPAVPLEALLLGEHIVVWHLAGLAAIFSGLLLIGGRLIGSLRW